MNDEGYPVLLIKLPNYYQRLENIVLISACHLHHIRWLAWTGYFSCIPMVSMEFLVMRWYVCCS